MSKNKSFLVQLDLNDLQDYQFILNRLPRSYGELSQRFPNNLRSILRESWKLIEFEISISSDGFSIPLFKSNSSHQEVIHWGKSKLRREHIGRLSIWSISSISLGP